MAFIDIRLSGVLVAEALETGHTMRVECIEGLPPNSTLIFAEVEDATGDLLLSFDSSARGWYSELHPVFRTLDDQQRVLEGTG